MDLFSLGNTNVLRYVLDYPITPVLTPLVHGTYNGLRARRVLDPRRENHPLYNIFISLLTTFGGSIIFSMVLDKPVWWWHDSRAISFAILVIYLSFYSPFDIFHKIVNFAPCVALIDLFEVLLVVRTSIGALERAALTTDQNWWAMLAAGTFSSCCGKLLLNFEMRLRSRHSLTEFSNPTWSLRLPFYVTLLFMIGTRAPFVSARFTPGQVEEFILLFFFLNTVTGKVLNKAVNPFVLFEEAIYWLFFDLKSVEPLEVVEPEHHTKTKEGKERKKKKEKDSDGVKKKKKKVDRDGEGIEKEGKKERKEKKEKKEKKEIKEHKEVNEKKLESESWVGESGADAATDGLSVEQVAGEGQADGVVA